MITSLVKSTGILFCPGPVVQTHVVHGIFSRFPVHILTSYIPSMHLACTFVAFILFCHGWLASLQRASFFLPQHCMCIRNGAGVLHLHTWMGLSMVAWVGGYGHTWLGYGTYVGGVRVMSMVPSKRISETRVLRCTTGSGCGEA
jgi:hypothetical protein